MYFSFSPSPPATSYNTLPMDIPSTSSSRPQSPSCAFPSWPRRSSLDSNEDRETSYASSYISDADLEDFFPCVFEEQHDFTPLATPSRSPEFREQVIVDTGAMMRELIAQEKAKKEKERERRRRKSGPKKSRSGSGASNKHMSPIAEAGE